MSTNNLTAVCQRSIVAATALVMGGTAGVAIGAAAGASTLRLVLLVTLAGIVGMRGVRTP